MSQRTLVLLKPDCLERRLAGTILARFERKGFRIVGMKLMSVTPEIAAQHYAEHVSKPFYPNLLKYITSDPVVAVCLEGRDVVSVVRKMVGVTKGYLAEPGTIRGDFSISGQKNLVHASDSPESAERETAIFFKPEELVTWKTSDSDYLLSESEKTE
ncbi:MAG: nucleoside-diphosphate kinase [Thermoguttaceae bacterium]|nr:nucleoside-diphosphate kinase [Thermoguttaceae bacterium]MDO4425565.1 nucleoside-diphosphate kinase [Planctomycetia bacterium]